MPGGSTVTGVPTQLLPLAWQVAQATPATAAWFIGGLLLLITKLVKLLALWQLSQAAEPVGTWLAGGRRRAGGAMLAKLLPVAWHCAQLLAIFTWFIVATL